MGKAHSKTRNTVTPEDDCKPKDPFHNYLIAKQELNSKDWVRCLTKQCVVILPNFGQGVYCYQTVDPVDNIRYFAVCRMHPRLVKNDEKQLKYYAFPEFSRINGNNIQAVLPKTRESIGVRFRMTQKQVDNNDWSFCACAPYFIKMYDIGEVLSAKHRFDEHENMDYYIVYNIEDIAKQNKTYYCVPKYYTANGYKERLLFPLIDAVTQEHENGVDIIGENGDIDFNHF